VIYEYVAKNPLFFFSVHAHLNDRTCTLNSFLCTVSLLFTMHALDLAVHARWIALGLGLKLSLPCTHAYFTVHPRLFRRVSTVNRVNNNVSFPGLGLRRSVKRQG
jgi:hypothetical protein